MSRGLGDVYKRQLQACARIGATQVVFEGVPTFPNAGRFWDMIQKHKVTGGGGGGGGGPTIGG